MDINELITQASTLAGDNQELSSALERIKSASSDIITKKDELLSKISETNGGIKELGGLFGVNKESVKEILADIANRKSEFETKINSLSGDKDGVVTKYADLEARLNEALNKVNNLTSENETEKKTNLLNKKSDEIKIKLSENGIKDVKAQKLALATLREDHGDLLSITDVEDIVKKFAQDNLKLVEPDLMSGNGSKIKLSDLSSKKYSDLTPTEKVEYNKQKYGLKS